jgi:2-methylaconitate cis-trans-isomerase PrpF
VVDPYPCDASQAAIQEDVRAITVGQPAGCSTAMVKVKDGLPVSTLMTRTARHIMNGSIPTDPKMQLHPAHDRH